MTSAPTSSPVIVDDGVYAPILRVLLSIMTPEEREPVEEILAMGARSESGEEAS